MQVPIRIALVGNKSKESIAHKAICLSIDLSAIALGIEVSYSWIETESITSKNLSLLLKYHAIWCVPGSPYKSMEGALSAIQIARESKIPFLGTCGGFQHAILEYARNVLHLEESDHLESNPKASLPLITPLFCSLIGQEGQVTLQPGSQIKKIYEQTQITETFNCNYGVNPTYQYLLKKNSKLHITGVDQSGNIRVVELEGHPFFIATLYQPERLALKGTCHPLIKAFILSAYNFSNQSFYKSSKF